jgi:peptidoglycan/LPS O-acetylase OafA/YrhL
LDGSKTEGTDSFKNGQLFGLEIMQTNIQLELKPLTSARFVGAAWVALYHFPEIFEAFPFLDFVRPLISNGNYGVTFFFILSGFLIQHNYGGGI